MRIHYWKTFPIVEGVAYSSYKTNHTQDLCQLAEDMGMMDRLRSIALGQGQGKIAAAMIEKVIGRRR